MEWLRDEVAYVKDVIWLAVATEDLDDETEEIETELNFFGSQLDDVITAEEVIELNIILAVKSQLRADIEAVGSCL